MSKHNYNTLILLILIAICFLVNMPFYVFFLIFLVFVGITTWGVFDIRLSYFVQTICFIKNRPYKTVILSFDDGPTELTPKFLELLKNSGAKAIFFCIGTQIEKYPHIVKQIQEEGHFIGNHTFTHKAKNCFLPTKNLVEEIQKTDVELAKLGIKTDLFRPPFGVTNPHISRAISLTNKKVIGWDIRSLDTIITNEEKLLKRITSKLSHGNIILMHDTSERSLRVLEHLLKYLTKNNYKITNDLNCK